ncbi:flagellar basal body P-ring formation chaperone FlgA [Dyella silvatica]|uniref:flagellar basal body P-ring formation chaperone FlgA n=1 Tax=Dyella silvatica TaxID=2992128 RepID=UPI00225585F1|nr:flagellar basal body P-ring formation chaperone FlgA [Dyella silvatica]
MKWLTSIGISIGVLCVLPLDLTAATPSSDADAIVAAAQSSVEQRLGSGYSRVELIVTGRPERVSHGSEHVEYRATPVTGHWPRARFRVMVEVRVKGRLQQTVPVGFALAAYAPAWVYRENVSDRAIAEDLSLSQQTADVAASAAEPVASPELLKGMRLRRVVRAGQVVTKADFEPVPDIDNRQRVKLLAAFGAITVESVGVAMQAGNKGDVVPIQVAGNSQPVKATITDRGVAQVVP